MHTNVVIQENSMAVVSYVVIELFVRTKNYDIRYMMSACTCSYRRNAQAYGLRRSPDNIVCYKKQVFA